MTSNPSSFVHLLRQRALDEPETQIYQFLPDGENEQATLSYGELDLRARAIAAQLQSEGATGERALLIYPPGLDYIAAFFGCLYANTIAVPIYPPRANRNMERIQSIVGDADAKYALTTNAVLSRNGMTLTSESNALRWLATDNIANDCAVEWQQPAVNAESLAYLQYTSGSTSSPKGVMVSHGNLLYNSADMDEGWRHTRDSVLVSWLPHFHDMGLIYGILQPLYKGCQSVLMPPIAFLQQPVRWLQTITRYRGTHSAAPNFAYELCIRKVTPEQRATLDLSSWLVAVNGAEPVRRETIDRFTETFASCGFRRQTFCPGYGLAEATLKVVATSQTDCPVFYSVDSDALAQHRVVEAEPENRDSQTFVSCGRPMLETKIAIVNPELLQQCCAGEVGEIWVTGPTVTQGYWRRTATGQDFGATLLGGNDTYLRTGDLGFTINGELFVTGRLKDLIIIRGRNHYPQDLELTTERSHPYLRSGCGAAFSLEEGGTDLLVIVQEVERNAEHGDFAEVFGAIRQAVASEHELHASGVVLIKSGSLPKTSSGKVQRHAARKAFLAGALDTVAVSWIAESRDSVREHHLDRESLLAIEPAERRAAVSEYLVEQLAQRLDARISSINHQQPLGSFGLDSLMALELSNSITADLRVVISPAKLLGDESVDELAAELVAQLETQSSTIDIDSAVNTDEYPLSYGQRALWFVYQLDPTSPAYNVMYAARTPEGADVQTLRLAWQALIDRHAALRTTYHVSNSQPVQKVHAHQHATLIETDASNWSTDELHARLIEAGELPFSLEDGPVARLQLFRQTNEDILLLSMAHIACDFWSLDLLVAELFELYNAKKSDRPATLPATKAEYSGFVKWQEKMLSGEEGETHSSYWLQQLSGELTTLDLPIDRSSTPAQNHHGATQVFSLKADLVQRLKTLARTEGATPFTILLAAFQVLLQRYTGQREIVVGVPAAGRSRAEFADVVGYFVNPVVARADLSGNPTFKQFLAQTRRTVLSALDHQDYPFPLLVERLQPVRDERQTPLFQVTFAWDKLQRLEDQRVNQRENLAGNTHAKATGWETLFWNQGGAPFHLMMAILESSGSLDVNLRYNADLFDQTTISRMARHFQTILAGIAAQPEQHVLDLPLLAEAEREQLLLELNNTEADFDDSLLVHQLFEIQAGHSPGDCLECGALAPLWPKRRQAAALQGGACAPALVFGNRRMSYGELNARANQLARHLRARGVGAETKVAICMQRTPESVVGILGIVKAGGAYVPLDPTYPAERLAFILADIQAHVLITDSWSAPALPEVNAQIICLDTDWNAISLEESTNFTTDIVADNLAYIIYTSGTTGRPKGVQITHAALLNLVNWHQRTFEITPADVATQLAGAGFDASVWELWPYLTAGASLHLIDDDTRSSPERLRNYLLSKEITISFLPTPLAESVLALHWPETCALRVMLTGGDKLHRYPAQEKPFVLANNYGPTENTVVATSGTVSCREDAVPSIGRPISNVQIYLLDSCLQPVVMRAPGEIYIGGASLARGYLNRAELTAEKLIPDPFSKQPGARLYRTGDLARYRTDGQIEFLGRIDRQVKIRGFRIELEEIEAVLAQHPALQEAVVLAREDHPGDKRLVGYIVAKNEPPSVAELRAYLKQTLPDYMIPSVFLSLEALPLNHSGKIDRRALPAPDTEHFAPERSWIAPRSSVEELLAKIWCEVLDLEQVSVDDNFFELGGHSLLMAQVMSRLRDSLQLDIPLRTLLAAPSISDLAEAIVVAAREEQLDVEKIAQLWLTVEQLSPVEIEAALLQEATDLHGSIRINN
ncbi:MAG TPA: amino acid adenylation domain-containing protein [Pyrinomonadaceae bacterium]|nr:amino acid adenylation domain-containing protein [Pyrinomonadaceae bacterium]